MLGFLFGNTITRKVEKKNKMEGQVEVLKKQQKVESEGVCKEYANKKAQLSDSIDAQINDYKARIIALKAEKTAQLDLLDKELKVQLDKVINDSNAKIVAKQHKIKSFENYIIAEKKNIEDVLVQVAQPNAPTSSSSKKLLENK